MVWQFYVFLVIDKMLFFLIFSFQVLRDFYLFSFFEYFYCIVGQCFLPLDLLKVFVIVGDIRLFFSFLCMIFTWSASLTSMITTDPLLPTFVIISSGSLAFFILAYPFFSSTFILFHKIIRFIPGDSCMKQHILFTSDIYRWFDLES